MARATCVFVSILVLSVWVFAQTRWSDQRDSRAGYLLSVEKEDRRPLQNLTFPEPPPPVAGRLTSSKIFDRDLTTEFMQKYRDNFGHTEAERTFNNQPLQGSFWSYIQTRDTDSKQLQQRQQVYGEYMLRRLADYHLDRHFREDPELKDVWEFKEKVRQVEVTVAKNIKIKSIYSYAANDITTNVESPYVNLRVAILMDPRAFGPSEIQEYLVSISRGFGSLGTEVFYRVRNGRSGFVLSKWLSPIISTSLTLARDWDSAYDAVENYALAGLVINY